jgi:hypothetical protein
MFKITVFCVHSDFLTSVLCESGFLVSHIICKMVNIYIYGYFELYETQTWNANIMLPTFLLHFVFLILWTLYITSCVSGSGTVS